jgi:hypothetical protein
MAIVPIVFVGMAYKLLWSPESVISTVTILLIDPPIDVLAPYRIPSVGAPLCSGNFDMGFLMATMYAMKMEPSQASTLMTKLRP